MICGCVFLFLEKLSFIFGLFLTGLTTFIYVFGICTLCWHNNWLRRQNITMLKIPPNGLHPPIIFTYTNNLNWDLFLYNLPPFVIAGFFIFVTIGSHAKNGFDFTASLYSNLGVKYFVVWKHFLLFITTSINRKKISFCYLATLIVLKKLTQLENKTMIWYNLEKYLWFRRLNFGLNGITIIWIFNRCIHYFSKMPMDFSKKNKQCKQIIRNRYIWIYIANAK